MNISLELQGIAEEVVVPHNGRGVHIKLGEYVFDSLISDVYRKTFPLLEDVAEEFLDE